MYETRGMGKYTTYTTGVGENMPPNAIASTPPSLNQHADTVLEGAGKLRSFVECLRDDLHQTINTAAPQNQPCRPGLDGKLIDTSDHHEAIYAALNQIRVYLLG